MSKLVVYILQLTSKNWYVGKTFNLEKRYTQHLRGEGSAWTSKYPPIRIFEKIENADDFDEDKYVKIYMNKYGINRVRGGSYISINLSKVQIQHLEKEIRMATNKCLKCGSSHHFAKDCENTPTHLVKNFTFSLESIFILETLFNICNY